MLNKYWKQFLSGSDIRGVATDSIESEKINLTNEAVQKIVYGFVRWVQGKTALPYSSMIFSVGHDPRISSFRIKTVVINSLRSLGIKVYDCSLTSTPAMFMSISTLSCTAAIQITASHHPANKNGLKFFVAEGGLSGSNIVEILELCQKMSDINVSSSKGEVKKVNMMSYYCNKLSRFICSELNCGEDSKPLENLKIVVDAGNGAGGFFATDVLKNLGADVSGSLFLDPDGNFPNHIPNPEDKDAIESTVRATVEAKADLGIIFDTDVDRVGIIDHNGSKIVNNRLIALASCIVLKKYPGSIIVTDSVTSDKLSEFISSLGGSQFRFKRGYNNVISAAKKLNACGTGCQLAIETSGHAAFKGNNFVDDGAYLACLIISELVNLKRQGKNIDDLLENFVDSKDRIELRIEVTPEKAEKLTSEVLPKFKAYCKTEIKNCEIDEDNLEGIRVRFTSRWQEGLCLLRKSVHDSALVINVDSYVKGGAKSIVNSIKPFFELFDFADFGKFDTNKS